MSNTFEHESTAAFEIKGKGVRVQLWTLLPSSEELGGITIRDHKGRTLARVTEDGFGDRDPKKIRVTVDLSEAFTQKLPRATSYHHSAEIFDALAPLIAGLPRSKWEKRSRPPKSNTRTRTLFEGVYVPLHTPHEGWRLFHEKLCQTLPKGHPALDASSKRWAKLDVEGYYAWIADTMPPFSEWLGWRREFLVDTRAHEATLGLSGNYGAPEIQRAFRLKAKHAHPDVGGSAEEFRRITEARDVLLRAVRMH